MNSAVIPSWRAAFPACVREAFGFLERDREFRMLEALPTYVCYETKQAFMNIVWGRRSYELSFEFGLRSIHRRHPFTSYGLAAFLGIPPQDVNLAAHDGAALPCAVEKLAAFLEGVSERLFPIDARLTAELGQFIARDAREYTAEVVLRPIRARAEIAWREQNYREFRQLFEHADPSHLTPIELKKLDYARRHA